VAEEPGEALFNSLRDWNSLLSLIDSGETEGAYLECKAPGGPQLNQGLKHKLGEALSGFANTNGGVILWGVSTTKRGQEGGLDVLTQLEPVGNAGSFARQVDIAIPALAYPRVNAPASRVIHQRAGQTRGVIATYIPKSSGDPVSSSLDRQFYMRSGDSFVLLPYEILKRMFTGTAGPDLSPNFESHLIKKAGQSWTLPIILTNGSSAAATITRIVVNVANAQACDSIAMPGWIDLAEFNPGKTIFSRDLNDPIFRGMDRVAGDLTVVMKRGRRPKRMLSLQIQVFSTNMRARAWTFTIHLTNQGFKTKNTVDRYLY
jgi:hypothetical protein